MTLLHLQEATELSIKSKGVWVEPRLGLPSVIVIAIVATALLALGLKTAYGRRLDEQMRTTTVGAQVATQNSALGMDLIRELRRGHLRQLNAQVRFKSVENQGSRFVIEGKSLSAVALSDLISSLRSTGYFSDIEINETYQEDQKNKSQAVEFQLTCEVQTGTS